MAKMLKKCILCGKEYRYCSRCKEFEHLPSWYNLFDSQGCHDIYHAIDDYKVGKIEIADAKEIIKNNKGIKVLDRFSEDIAAILSKRQRKDIVKED